MIGRITAKIRTSLAIRGPLGTLRLCQAKIIRLLKGLTPSHRAAARREREADQEFDRQYGVDTSGMIQPSASAVQGSHWVYGLKYQGVHPTLFNQVFQGLSIPYEEFVFIDFGSGKGRAVLLAAGFPFKNIVGVEYCDNLNCIARQNLARYPDTRKLCEKIDLICMDAAEYDLPDEPLVLFFYNPFGRPVMEKVIENVVNSFRRNPRRMVVVYLTPEYGDMWDRVPILKRSPSHRVVWDTGPVGTAS